MLVLKIFHDEPDRWLCGYELMKATGIRSGTMYPTLARLRSHGIFKTRYEAGTAEQLGRPIRLFYGLTRSGQRLACEVLSTFAA